MTTNPNARSSRQVDPQEEKLETRCPACSRRYRVPAKSEGSQAKCRCGETFTVEAIYELMEPIETPAPFSVNQAGSPQDSAPARNVAAQGYGVRSQDMGGDDHRRTTLLYWLGVAISLLGVYAPFLLAMPLLYALWLASDPPGAFREGLALLGFPLGVLLTTGGAVLWSLGKGRSFIWGVMGLAWPIGLVGLYLLEDHGRSIRQACGDADEYAVLQGLNETYRELPAFRRHALQSVVLYIAIFSTPVMILLSVPLALRGLGPVFLLLFASPLLLLIPIATLWSGGISLPPRRGDRSLRGWGAWRLMAMILIVLGWSGMLVQALSSARREAGAIVQTPQSAEAAAHAVAAAMIERWDAMRSGGRNPTIQKKLVWVAIEGYDPETRCWVGRIKTSGHQGPTLREFTARVSHRQLDLDLYTHDSPIPQLRADGEFIRITARIDYQQTD